MTDETENDWDVRATAELDLLDLVKGNASLSNNRSV